MAGAGRQRRPQILADLHAQAELRHLLALEQERGAERHLLPSEPDGAQPGGGRVVVALFIEFAVIGQVGLGYQTQQPAMADHRGAVVQLALHQHRQAYQCYQVQFFAGLQNGGKAGFGRLLQGLLQKQVTAGVAGQAQFRENGQLYALGGCFLHGLNGHLGVVGAIGHPKGRGDCAGFDKTVCHDTPSFAVCLPGRKNSATIKFYCYHTTAARQEQGRAAGTARKNAKENLGTAERLDGQSLENETIARIFLKKTK